MRDKKEADDALMLYIERQRHNVRIMVPDADTIDDADFVDICLLVLDATGELRMQRSPNGKERPVLKPGFVPQLKTMGMLAAACDARVRATRSGATERFVASDDPSPRPPGPAPLTEKPIVEPELEQHIREMQRFFASLTPEYEGVPHEEFCRSALPRLAASGLAMETQVAGRSVWRPTRRLRRMMRRTGERRRT